ncbi:MAG: cupredoxin domain-containing protein [Gemmatimonas sp.]
MTSLDWAVVAAGTSAVAWINWYFFVDHSAAAAAAVPTAGNAAAQGAAIGNAVSGDSAMQQATIVVAGGYSPSTVKVRAGQPVRLVFDRQETSGCSEEVVFADFGIRRFLPANQQTVIELTPPQAGTYTFTCGMGMLRGKLVAE